MVFERPAPRITSSTFAALSERNIAAWPAELPPPATINRRAAAELPFTRSGRIIDPAALEFLASLGFQPMIIRAGRDDDALRAKGRVAALRLHASPVLAVGEPEDKRLRRRRKASRQNDAPEAARCTSVRPR